MNRLAMAALAAALLAGCRREHPTIRPEAAPSSATSVASATSAPAASAPNDAPSGTEVHGEITLQKEDTGYVNAAVPFKPASPAHRLGTILLLTQSGLYEVDLDSLVVVRKTEHVAEQYDVLAATPEAVAIVRRREDCEVLVLDGDLRQVALHRIEAQAKLDLAAGSGSFVVAQTRGSDGRHSTDFFLFDAKTGELLRTANHRIHLGGGPNPEARIVVAGDRIHALVTLEPMAIHSFDERLAKVGVIPLPRRTTPDFAVDGVWLPEGRLAVAGSELVLTQGVRVFAVDPKRRRVRALPSVPEGAPVFLTFAADDAGHLVMDNGFWARRMGDPWTELVKLDRSMWKLSESDIPMYRNAPAAAFFWSNYAVVITQFPDVYVRKIALDRP